MEGTETLSETEDSALAEATPKAAAKENHKIATGSRSSRSGSANSRRHDTDRAGTANRAPERPKAEVSLRTLLQAGAHFGHQTSRWFPGMAPYIYTARNGIHIINLPKTVQTWKVARQAIVEMASDGGSILFVGTKKQAQDAVMEEAGRCNAHFVSRRWLGGMLTNFPTIRKRIERINKLEAILREEEELAQQGAHLRFTKKERLMMSRELEKLNFSLGGIRSMHGLPQMLFVIDIRREDIAVKEARRLDIPVVALVDTNCDPQAVNYAIPSNDDGTRAIRLFCAAVADAMLEGQAIYAARPSAERQAREERLARAAEERQKQAEQNPAPSDDTPASDPL